MGVTDGAGGRSDGGGMRLNLNVRGLKDSATVAINERCERLRDSGRNVYRMGLGQSPFPVPEAVVATLRAFQGGMDIERYLINSRRILSALARESHQRLTAAGIDVVMPDGSFYLFPDFSPLRERLARRDITRAQTLCRRPRPGRAS